MKKYFLILLFISSATTFPMEVLTKVRKALSGKPKSPQEKMKKALKAYGDAHVEHQAPSSKDVREILKQGVDVNTCVKAGCHNDHYFNALTIAVLEQDAAWIDHLNEAQVFPHIRCLRDVTILGIAVNKIHSEDFESRKAVVAALLRNKKFEPNRTFLGATSFTMVRLATSRLPISKQRELFKMLIEAGAEPSAEDLRIDTHIRTLLPVSLGGEVEPIEKKKAKKKKNELRVAQKEAL